ncbi:helix-turn-helix domain-containing protein [Dysgonomonas sp. Marseille-P4677]|uniref:helix-turn-helix domain-containing protein n=1 Tax=Dysgonomonas sp. Marseille-P4677 TaxID=2364790 RepID=UPI0019117C21|nr:helix-turn-helix domain-containing protein [Dysgonomonas sp. Marseille-P4677]MBK5722295.1 helix-turn-helix domain-containing protein [Dysgonomonas sp. Marseille-P4677]
MEELITKRNKDVIAFFEGLEEIITCMETAFSDTSPLFNGERYLTDREVSGLLKVSRRTLQDYRSQGVISYIQLGGKILYRESDIRRLLEGNYIEAFRK